VTAEVRFCPHCGTRRTGYFRFCGRCGLDFDELTVGRPPEATEPKPEPTTPIWPPPVQWPPPDTAPTPPEPDPEPQSVIWPQQRAPVTPARIVRASTDRPIPSESLAPPEHVSAAPPIRPVPAAPVSRRPAVTWTRIAIVVLAALLGVSAISRAMTSSPGSTPRPTVAVGTPLIVASPSPSTAPGASFTPGPSFGPTGQTQLAVVTRIVDGDTIRVTIDGTEFPVRYIGIDAPEPDTTDPAVKQLADAATATNAALVEGQNVVLERDVSERDEFDRLLRNVWLVDSGGSQVLVNLELVRLGFAAVTTFPPDEKYVDLLTSAQAAAQSEALGLWASASPSP
jgi:endonuclease YncB( thermonuclease family)